VGSILHVPQEKGKFFLWPSESSEEELWKSHPEDLISVERDLGTEKK
jgi:hypothetical protein